MTAHADCFQIHIKTTITTDYITNYGRHIGPVDISWCKIQLEKIGCLFFLVYSAVHQTYYLLVDKVLSEFNAGVLEVNAFETTIRKCEETR
jgi:hypothetical protein